MEYFKQDRMIVAVKLFHLVHWMHFAQMQKYLYSDLDRYYTII